MPSTRITKRLRVFAGPNGSGKSTIIDRLRKIKISGFPLDFGVYVNADRIAELLRQDKFSFREFKIPTVDRQEFLDTAERSGLLNTSFSKQDLSNSFVLHKNLDLSLSKPNLDERVAQILAEFLRWKLIDLERKLSIETVFSHPSKLKFLEAARAKGYKIYLYFISTEDPEINIARVKDIRVSKGGHDVPKGKIKSRYANSMKQLFDAAQLAYQAYFFDNSVTTGQIDAEPFAHFKLVDEKKVWDPIDNSEVPSWFIKHYSEKARKPS